MKLLFHFLDRRARAALPLALAALVFTGCSVKRAAVNLVGDALAGGGTTFAGDNDPELVKAAVPFSLKLMESLLAESTNHVKLLEAAAGGFTQYAYAFVQLESEELRATDLARAREMQARARKLYLRARDYGLRGLAVRQRGFAEKLAADPKAAVAKARQRDVGLLYWTAASWVAAIAMDKTDAYLISDLPKIEALLARALELDADYDAGVLHSVMITYEMVRQGTEGDPVTRATASYEKAVALSQGQLAGPHVSFAESVCIPTERRKEFIEALDKALAVEIEARPDSRLVNLVMQRRARWLKERVDKFFLPPLDDEKPNP